MLTKFSDYTDEELLGKAVTLHGCRIDGKIMSGTITRVKKRFFEVTVKFKDGAESLRKFDRINGYGYPKCITQHCELK